MTNEQLVIIKSKLLGYTNEMQFHWLTACVTESETAFEVYLVAKLITDCYLSGHRKDKAKFLEVSNIADSIDDERIKQVYRLKNALFN